jgi:hypothetical protein
MTSPQVGHRMAFGFVVLFFVIALAPSLAMAAGSISGSVTKASDATAIANATVSAYDNNWNYVASTVTGGDGSYILAPLNAGNYYLHTTNTAGYIDSFYRATPGAVTRGNATAIAVTDGMDTPGMNFSLSAGAGSISGTVLRDPELTAIQDVVVIAYQWVDITSLYAAWATTDASGNYSIPGLTPGSFYLKTTNSLGYINKYYNNVDISGLATTVSVTAGADSSGKDFSLTMGGSISGRVTADSDGEGIEGVRIYAAKNVDFTEMLSRPAVYTDSDGYYSVIGLTAGYYMISTSGASTQGYIEEYYDDTFIYTRSDVYVALSINTPGINFGLAQGGSISGRITRDSDGTGIANAFISIYDADWYQKWFATTDSSGYFSAKGLASGSYYLQASPTGYFAEYYGNATSRTTAAAIPVIQGVDTPSINLSLATNPIGNGSISGTVTGPFMSTVTAYDQYWNSKGSTTAYSGNTYTISNLAPGDYYVAADGSGYIIGFYNNVISRGAATAVEVESGVNTPNINFALSNTGGGTISGTVTREWDGAGIYNAQVNIYDFNWNPVKSTRTNSAGGYTVSGLLPGDYYVATYRNKGLLDEYYDDVASPDAASTVPVTAGVTTSGVNFVLSKAWAISVSVSCTTGESIWSGIKVNVFDGDWNLIRSGYTDPKSETTSAEIYMEGFSPGTYYLKATDNEDFIDQYYFNAASPDDAYAITIYDDIAKESVSYTMILNPTAPVLADFDDDVLLNSDMTVWRQGTWFTLLNDSPVEYGSTSWGLASDIPVLGDYDGDGEADITVWRPDSGTWFNIPSDSPETYTATNWGLPTDTPVPGDYDGDKKTDSAVYRADAGTWYILLSAFPGEYRAIQWGIDTDVPVPNDYDGDGKTDVAVWRPEGGAWFILPSESPGTYIMTQWGIATDKPVPGDYDRDGKADIAVWRTEAGMWYILPSGDPANYIGTHWGLPTDIPVPGDYDGDGKMDIAVWRPGNGTWYVLPSGSPGTYTGTEWGMTGDLPISAATSILQSLD